jgi:hypothetical protein
MWPKQARPFEKSWTLWREALKHAHLSPEVLRATKARISLPLNVPLGAWIGTRHRAQRTWDSYVSPDNNTLYQSRIVGYRLHKNLKGTFRNRRFNLNCFSALPDLSLVPCIIPVSVKPATRSLEASKLTRPASIIDDSVSIQPDIIATFFDCNETLDDWKHPLLEYLECISDDNRLHELLSSGE